MFCVLYMEAINSMNILIRKLEQVTKNMDHEDITLFTTKLIDKIKTTSNT